MRTIIPAIGTVSFQKELSIDGLINNNSANHYIFTTTAVIGSLMLYYLLSGFTNPDITMLVSLSTPATLVIGFIYSRQREAVNNIIKIKKDASLCIIGVFILAPIGTLITYLVSRAIG